MDTRHSQTCRTPEHESCINGQSISLPYILDWVKKIGLGFKIVGIGKVCIGTDSHASEGSVLVCCHLHTIHNDLCGERELQAWWIESGPRCKC